MSVSEINFLNLYPIDEFARGVNILLAKNELASRVSMKILLSVTVNQRVFVFDNVVSYNSSVDIGSKLQSTLQKVNSIVQFTTEKRKNILPHIGFTKELSLKCDLFVKDKLGGFTWGVTNITAEYPNGISGGSPRIEVLSKASEELFEKYSLVKGYLKQPIVPLFDDNKEFIVKSEKFYEVYVEQKTND